MLDLEYHVPAMKQKFSIPAHFLLIMAWLLVTMTHGFVVLCIEHHDQSKLEFTFHNDCKTSLVIDDAFCQEQSHETCMEQEDCSDIPVNLNSMIAPNIQRQCQINMLSIMPIALHRIATELLCDAMMPISFSRDIPSISPVDPAMATGSVVLVI